MAQADQVGIIGKGIIIRGNLTGGGNVNRADQLRGWFARQHDDRLRWDVDRWSHTEHERGRNSARARGKPKLPKLQ